MRVCTDYYFNISFKRRINQFCLKVLFDLESSLRESKFLLLQNIFNTRINMMLITIIISKMYPFSIFFLLTTPVFSLNSSEKMLLDHLLKDYTLYARPVLNRSEAVKVKFGFELIHVISLVETVQTIQVKVWMRLSWRNEYMIWDPKHFSGIKSTRLGPGKVWIPDIYLVEEVGSDMSSGPEKYKTAVILNHDGMHYWNIPALLHSSCLFDVTNFPFDHQYCTFKFLSWTHDQTEIDIIMDMRPVLTKNYINSSEWQLHQVKRKIVTTKYNCCPNPYVYIQFSLHLHRESHYYFYNVVIPCIIQMLIILVTFFLPPDSGERIGVAITVLLVFAVYLDVLSSALPKTSATTPAMSRFYLAAMAGSAFSIIATCFVLVIHFKGAEKGIGPMPKWVKEIFLKRIAVFLCVRQNLRVHKDDELLALEKMRPSEDFKLDEKLNTVDRKNGLSENGIKKMVKRKSTIDKLVEEVRVITALIHDQNLQDEIEEEWQILAKVFDRIFFFIFLAVFLASSLVILYPVYHAHIEKM